METKFEFSQNGGNVFSKHSGGRTDVRFRLGTVTAIASMDDNSDDATLPEVPVTREQTTTSANVSMTITTTTIMVKTITSAMIASTAKTDVAMPSTHKWYDRIMRPGGNSTSGRKQDPMSNRDHSVKRVHLAIKVRRSPCDHGTKG